MSSRDRPDALGARFAAVWTLAAIALLVLIALWQRNGYWEYSDGVYALTARLLLDGHDLYGEVAAAQPPPIFLFGAAVLAVSDTPTALRIALAAVQLATAALVLLAVWRLTRSRGAAGAAGLVALLSPWALREHAQLIPETFAAPLLLAAALLLARADGARRAGAAAAAGGDAGGGATAGGVGDGRAAGAARAGADASDRAVVAAGALAALACAFKVAFVVPAVVLLLVGAPTRVSRLHGLLAFAVTGVVLALAALVAFGEPLLDGAVRAQRETGLAGLGYVSGLWAQAGWNLLPLLACAALAWPLRARLADQALARCLAAASAGALLLLATLFKSGSYLTVLVAIEPPLLCLAAAGVTAAWRARGEQRAAASVPPAVAGAALAAAGTPPATAGAAPGSVDAAPAPRAGAARWALPLAVAAIGLGVVQVGSLVVDPGDPRPFTRPFAQSGPGWTLSPAEVDRAVAQIRACPSDDPIGGPPYLAFIAGRRIAGDQPDQFILDHAPLLAPLRAQIAADPPRCP